MKAAKLVASLDLKFRDPDLLNELVCQIGKRRPLVTFEPKLIFKGFRPESTSQLHEQYQKPSSSFCVLKQDGQENFSQNYKFDSQFESGNLDMVVQTSETDFNMYLRPDTNTRGYCNWFYFKMTRANRQA